MAKKMKWGPILTVGGLGLAAWWLYATFGPGGSASSQTLTIAQGQTGQQINMRVGDKLVAPGQTQTPILSGPSLFGGTEAQLNGGSITATTPGTVTMTWGNGTNAMISVSA